MKKFLLLICFIFICLNLFTEEMVFLKRLQSKFQLNDELTIKEICESLNLEISSFYKEFKISDEITDRVSIKSQGIVLDDVYQYFIRTIKIDDICKSLDMPINQIASRTDKIDFSEKSFKNYTLSDVGLDIDDIETMLKDFEKNKLNFISILVILGISITFVALLITCIVINQLAHLSKIDDKSDLISEKKKTDNSIAITQIKKEQSEVLDELSIAAVIATIHRVKMDTVQESKILLTWRRANINMWRATGKTETPSQKFQLLKKR